jgi:hypothetical protein
MSTKGSQPRQLNRDAAKCRKNFDLITKDTRKPTDKQEVPKEELPTGIRTRIIYGKQP